VQLENSSRQLLGNNINQSATTIALKTQNLTIRSKVVANQCLYYDQSLRFGCRAYRILTLALKQKSGFLLLFHPTKIVGC